MGADSGTRNAAPAAHREADPRWAAVAVLTAVLAEGRSLNAALDEHAAVLRDGRDRAFARELCYGVLRWLPRLEICLQRLMEKPLRAKETLVRAVLLLGLYQMMFTRVAEHAAVGESVALARRAGKPWAAALVNGVLRSFQRRRAELDANLLRDEQGRYAHPAWLARATRDAWPADWERILESNNERPPLCLRVNGRRSSREDYLAELVRRDIAASVIDHTSHGVRLHAACEVRAVPGFEEGLVSVQDGAAQLCPGLLELGAEMRVLDACAAPGGKSAHILEHEPALRELVAVDRDGDRLQRVKDNLRRLSLQATTLCADAGEPRQWWNGEPFQRILVDAPCSGTGVIRRHPDIKLHRRASDLEALIAAQSRLLTRLWPLLAPRGLLLYATCSYLPRENDHVLADFLANHPDASGKPMPCAWGHATGHGRQVLPGQDTMDGFYYALLGKR